MELALLLMLGVGKVGNAQNTDTDDFSQHKTENIKAKKITTSDVDTVQFDSVSNEKNGVKFSDVAQSMYMEVEAFSFATPYTTKLIWTPLFVIKPTVTFNNKLSVGFTTTQMVQNYTTENMTAIMHDMYAHAELKFKKFETFANVGYFSALNYAGESAKYMPISYFFENAIKMHSGHYMPSAAMLGVRNEHFSVGAGYAEFGPKLQFNGGGDFVIVGEAFFDKLKIGTFWMLNKGKYVGDLQLMYKSDSGNFALFELLNIGSPEFGIHGIYAFGIAKDAVIFVNGYKQFNDGIAGAQVGIRHMPSGVYLSCGVTCGNILLSNTNGFEVSPVIELGCRQALVPLVKAMIPNAR